MVGGTVSPQLAILRCWAAVSGPIRVAAQKFLVIGKTKSHNRSRHYASQARRPQCADAYASSVGRDRDRRANYCVFVSRSTTDYRFASQLPLEADTCC